MGINQTGGFDQLKRVDSVSGNQSYDDPHDGRRRRKVTYQGRTWEESEEELPLQPTPPVIEQKKIPQVYADKAILEKVNRLLESFTTLEDKIAGIFFFETDAYYDIPIQKEIEQLITKWKIGGLLFVRGDYKRQLYLVEQYQRSTLIPLLIGNDFDHSLSYYFADEAHQEWGSDKMDVKYFSDLGKAVIFQNRRLGVHFQLAEKRSTSSHDFFPHAPLTEAHLRAFRKGIRDAHGVMGIFGYENKKFTSLENAPIPSPFAKEGIVGGERKEIFSLKALTFLDVTLLPLEEVQEKLIASFTSNVYDAFLFSLPQKNLIDFVAQGVREGKIDEKAIEKRLMKVLALKSCF